MPPVVMQFETLRLCIRDWHPGEDACHAMDIYGDARVADWMKPGCENISRDTSIRQVQRRLERYVDQAKTTHNGTRSWAVVQKDIGRVIGSVVLATLPDMKERPDTKERPDMKEVRTGWVARGRSPPLFKSISESISEPISESTSESSASGCLSASGCIEDGLAAEYIEIGWYFRPSSWGFGYATEAANSILKHSFETLELPMLLAVSPPENARSVAVMQRLGMRPDGVTTRCYGGEPLLLYVLTAEAWARRFRG